MVGEAAYRNSQSAMSATDVDIGYDFGFSLTEDVDTQNLIRGYGVQPIHSQGYVDVVSLRASRLCTANEALVLWWRLQIHMEWFPNPLHTYTR
jgi:hypothetical protein